MRPFRSTLGPLYYFLEPAWRTHSTRADVFRILHRAYTYIPSDDEIYVMRTLADPCALADSNSIILAQVVILGYYVK